MQKTIIRFPNWLGDAVMAEPVLTAVKNAYPDTQLTVLIKAPLHLLFENHPQIDRLWVFEKTSLTKIKKENFDLGILLTNSLSSAWHFFKAGIKTRLGYKNDLRSVFLNFKVPFPKKKEHQLISYQNLLKPLKAFSFASPKMYVEMKEKTAIQEKFPFLKTSKKMVALSPFAAFGPAKSWPLENYLFLAKKLVQKDFAICFLGSRSFAKMFKEEIKKNRFGKFFLGKNIFNLIGKTNLKELAAVLSLSNLVIGNDSGPMHLAAALNCSQLALFGPTNPALTGPFYNPKATVIHKQFNCSPCYKKECDKEPFCMEEISVLEVLKKIENLKIGDPCFAQSPVK